MNKITVKSSWRETGNALNSGSKQADIGLPVRRFHRNKGQTSSIPLENLGSWVLHWNLGSYFGNM
jgi:hypothetical protein